jgi:hypothetical protein
MDELDLELKAHERISTLFGHIQETRLQHIKTMHISESDFTYHLLRTGLPTLRLNFQIQNRVTKQRLLNADSVDEPEVGYGAEQSLNILISPFISEEMDAYCRERGIQYLDLSGNSFISAQGLYISERGRPNAFPSLQKVATSVFERSSVVSSRILRTLMVNWNRPWKMQPLSDACTCSLGQVAKVKQYLKDNVWLEEQEEGFSIKNPKDFMHSWASVYAKKQNSIQNYYSLLPLPELEDHLSGLSSRFSSCVLTSFSGAVRLQPRVNYRKVQVYAAASDISSIVRQLELKRVDSGSNVEIIIPYDDVIYIGQQVVEGERIVSPVQLYLDLSSQKNRGEELAEHILEKEILHDDQA